MMIQKLRQKFIAVTMAVVFAVLTLIIFAINTVNIWQSNLSLDSVTQMLLENNGTFQKMPEEERPALPRDDKFSQIAFNECFHDREIPFSTRYFSVTLDEEQNILRLDLSSIASVTEQDAIELAAAVLARKGSTGWLQNWRYRIGKSEHGTLLIVLEATSTKSAILSVLGITLSVGLSALIAIFALLVPLSRKVFSPIADTYDKQRQFITDASHELKTPLTVITANAELLGMTGGENEWTEGILKQSRHMRILIEKMIQMSRLDEGSEQMSFEIFDLAEAVYDTAMSFQGPASTQGLQLTVEVPPTACRFKGNEGEIRRLISILMDNALKYCDRDGKISVLLESSNKGFGRERFSVLVSNTFSKLEILKTDRLFERFYRADLAHTEGSSYGLGLPIAKSIAQLHGGSLTAIKQPPDTIVFQAVLPVNGGTVSKS